MPVPELGRLEPVNVREIWEHEAHDFTPWLADNLDRLGTELGMNLELVATEVSTGPFYLDILARESDLEVNVAIENQLGGSDHGHLGQLLTYAAGHDARILIWVALDLTMRTVKLCLISIGFCQGSWKSTVWRYALGGSASLFTHLIPSGSFPGNTV